MKRGGAVVFRVAGSDVIGMYPHSTVALKLARLVNTSVIPFIRFVLYSRVRARAQAQNKNNVTSRQPRTSSSPVTFELNLSCALAPRPTDNSKLYIIFYLCVLHVFDWR